MQRTRPFLFVFSRFSHLSRPSPPHRPLLRHPPHPLAPRLPPHPNSPSAPSQPRRPPLPSRPPRLPPGLPRLFLSSVAKNQPPRIMPLLQFRQSREWAGPAPKPETIG